MAAKCSFMRSVKTTFPFDRGSTLLRDKLRVLTILLGLIYASASCSIEFVAFWQDPSIVSLKLRLLNVIFAISGAWFISNAFRFFDTKPRWILKVCYFPVMSLLLIYPNYFWIAQQSETFSIFEFEHVNVVVLYGPIFFGCLGASYTIKWFYVMTDLKLRNRSLPHFRALRIRDAIASSIGFVAGVIHKIRIDPIRWMVILGSAYQIALFVYGYRMLIVELRWHSIIVSLWPTLTSWSFIGHLAFYVGLACLIRFADTASRFRLPMLALAALTVCIVHFLLTTPFQSTQIAWNAPSFILLMSAVVLGMFRPTQDGDLGKLSANQSSDKLTMEDNGTQGCVTSSC